MSVTTNKQFDFDFSHIPSVKPYYALDYQAPAGMGSKWLVTREKELRQFFLGQNEIKVHLIDGTDNLILKNDWGYVYLKLGNVFDMVECVDAKDHVAFQKLFDFLQWELSVQGKGIMAGLPADFKDAKDILWGYGVCMPVAPDSKVWLSGHFFTAVLFLGIDYDAVWLSDGRSYTIVSVEVGNAYVQQYGMEPTIDHQVYANSRAKITHLPIKKGGHPLLQVSLGIKYPIFESRD